MLTEKQFVEAIESIDKQHRADLIMCNRLAKVFPNSSSADFIIDKGVIGVFIKTLKILFKDDHENSWIDYFCDELDFGRENWRLKVTEKGKEIPLKNASDLYKLLTKEK